MTRWAKENPTDFYRLYAKMLPAQQKAELERQDEQNEPQVVLYWPNNGKDPSAAERAVHLDSPEARAITGE